MKKLMAIMLIVVMAVFAASASGAVVVGTESASDVTAYQGDLSASDLLHGLTMSTGNVSGGGFHPASGIGAANDGIWDDGDADWVDDITYSNHGYDWWGIADFGVATDIGRVQTITGNVDNTPIDRIWQVYVLSVSYPGDPDLFFDIASVDYRPVDATAKVTIFDDASAVLASGVRKLKIYVDEDIPSPGTSHQQYYREWDVFAPAADGGVIPEPAGLGLIGLALLAVRKRS